MKHHLVLVLLILLGVSIATTTSAPPVVRIIYPLDDATVPEGPFTVEVEATDDVGVVAVKARLGSGPWEPCHQFKGCDPHWHCPLVKPPGPQIIRVEAFDEDGMASQDRVEVL